MKKDAKLFVEKYRPAKIEDCVLPDYLKNMFNSMIDKGELPNLLFYGNSGIGKTTVAKILCEVLGYEYCVINGSEQGNIDTLRVDVRNFASTISFGKNKQKVVIFDEADYLNPNSTQPALRGFIEEFHKTCRFILTCNFKNKIIPAIHSRCSVVEFKIPPEEKNIIAKDFLKRLCNILDNETSKDGDPIKYDKKILAKLVVKHFPDFRRVLNEVQSHSYNGVITSEILNDVEKENFDVLIGHLKNKEFRKCKEWAVENSSTGFSGIYRKLYDNLQDHLDEDSIPPAIIILADYIYRSEFVNDEELNFTACLTKLMLTCKFKNE